MIFIHLFTFSTHPDRHTRKSGSTVGIHRGWDASLLWCCLLMGLFSLYFDVLLFCFFRKTVGTHGREKTESPSGAKTKRETDNDGTDEVQFGKKAKLETVSSEEIM